MFGENTFEAVVYLLLALVIASCAVICRRYPNAKLLQKLTQKDGFEPKIYAKYMSPWLFLFAFVFLSLTIFFATDYAWLPVIAYVLLGGYTIFSLLALHADRLNRKTEASLTNDAENKKK